MSKLDISLENLGRAVDRLEEILPYTEDAMRRDGAIKRFEFTFELAWKTLRAAMIEEGVSVNASPKEILRQAYALGWIHDEDAWLAMLQDRNLSSHAYDETTALRIVDDLKAHTPHLRGVFDLLRGKYPETTGAQ